MTRFPESIPFSSAFLCVFGLMLEENYRQLNGGLSSYEDEAGATAAESFNADLSRAIGDTLAVFGIYAYSPEMEGEAGDWIAEERPDLFPSEESDNG